MKIIPQDMNYPCDIHLIIPKELDKKKKKLGINHSKLFRNAVNWAIKHDTFPQQFYETPKETQLKKKEIRNSFEENPSVFILFGIKNLDTVEVRIRIKRVQKAFLVYEMEVGYGEKKLNVSKVLEYILEREIMKKEKSI